MPIATGDGKHYNYFRDYDPAIGRYIESDPIGLEAGTNTFSYAESHPLVVSDPTGEMGYGGGGTAGTASYGEPNFGRLKQSCEAPCKHSVTMLHSTRGSGIPRTKTYDLVCLVTFATVGKGGGAATTGYMARRAPNFFSRAGFSPATVGRVSAAAAAWINPYFGLGVAALGMLEVFDECDCSRRD